MNSERERVGARSVGKEPRPLRLQRQNLHSKDCPARYEGDVTSRKLAQPVSLKPEVHE